MPKLSNVNSPKEVQIAGSANLVAGTLVVNSDTNLPVVVPSNQTASALATALGASGLKSIDLNARMGAYPSSGLCLFETIG
jgi:hypothetical protein